MKCTSILILTALVCAPVIKSSNILIFVPSPWKSHVVSFQPLFLELAHRGHNVTVVSKFAVKDPPHNYTQIVLNYEVDILKRIMNAVFKERSKYLFLFEDLYIRSSITVEITETYISSSDVQKFITDDRSSFDLVIVESFFQECTVALGHKYGAPVVNIIPLAPWVKQSLSAANPFDFSYIKDFKLDSGKTLDFQSRLLNTLFGLYGLFVEPVIYSPRLENMMNKYFRYPGYENRPTLTEMLKNVSLSLIDSDVTILSPRPYVPSFVEVPGIHIRPVQNISEKLQDFMDSANNGFVYFNMGTLLSVAGLPESTLSTITKVLGRLEQKVVFKWINNDSRTFPDNFHVDSWLPQLEILNHRNCKVFITHGGIHGIMETIYAGVPIIGFPVFSDQFHNVKRSEENGFATVSNIFAITEDIFERDLKFMLTDHKVKENAKRMSSIFHDRPISAIDKAIYWVEYVIRHKGAHHLRSSATDLTWYQYYLLDITMFIILIILSLVYICYFMTKCIMKLIFKFMFKQTKIKRS